MSVFEGSCVALITPFTEDGINFDALEKLIEFQIENGTDAILICGTTGEPPTMSAAEQKEAIRFSKEIINGRVPIIAGTGANSTAATIENCKMAEELGVDALLVVTPYYNKATQKGLIAHYQAVNDAVHTPIIVYNVPSRTNLNILPATMLEIAKMSNVTGLKDATGNIAQTVETAMLCNDYIAIYSGNDDNVVPVMACGGKGVISVASNVAPKLMHDMTSLYLKDDHQGAMEIQFKITPLVKALFAEVNPIPVKEAANILGFAAGIPRLPLTQAEPATIEKLTKELKALNLV